MRTMGIVSQVIRAMTPVTDWAATDITTLPLNWFAYLHARITRARELHVSGERVIRRHIHLESHAGGSQ
jgi:hypothetical protein